MIVKIAIFHVSNLNQESISLCGKFLRGELISSASANENIQERRRLVTVTLDRGIASTFKAGERVDIWVILLRQGKAESA